tara:strand:- start:991 stop:1314 length:324 start_codon:yes stop_codon:yes gene_type:complete
MQSPTFPDSPSRSPTRTSSPKRGFSSFLSTKKKPPTYKSDFPTPALAYNQKGGFYSRPEEETNIEGCPNAEQELHVCTSYCYENYAKLSTSEALMQHAKGSKSCVVS